MNEHRRNEDDQSPRKDRDDIPETDRRSKVPRRHEDTDAAGNARNDVGEDNHGSREKRH